MNYRGRFWKKHTFPLKIGFIFNNSLKYLQVTVQCVCVGLGEINNKYVNICVISHWNSSPFRVFVNRNKKRFYPQRRNWINRIEFICGDSSNILLRRFNNIVHLNLFLLQEIKWERKTVVTLVAGWLEYAFTILSNSSSVNSFNKWIIIW